MRLYFSAIIGSFLAIGLVALSANGTVAGDKKASKAGSTWKAAVSIKSNQTNEVSGTTYDEKQIALIKRIDEYFKALDNVKGKFVQYSADNKRMRGKYYIKRPGRFRFDYNRPSLMVIISDGRRMVIQDHDLRTEDEIPLKKTPFRVLLRKNVNILRDSRIKLLQETDDQIIIELQDKNKRISGGIKLFLTKKPKLELQEWITTDIQGLKTRIELVTMKRVEKLSAKLFTFRSLHLPKF